MVHPVNDPDRDPPPPSSDPRLEIPEVLRAKPSPADKPKQPVDMTETAKAWGVALDFVITTVAGAVVGWLLDRWLGTKPWGTVVGLGLGFATAFVRIIRFTQRTERLEREARELERKSRKTPPPNTP